MVEVVGATTHASPIDSNSIGEEGRCENNSGCDMWKNIGYEQCLTFINCQLRPGGTPPVKPFRPAITISRMAGSGGRTIASRLAEYLQARAPVECGWTVFDRNLLAKVLQDHHLPTRIAEFMPEQHKSMLEDALEELLGLHPDSWTLLQQTAQTILRLAHMGYVILVGRGANLITRKMENAFHVRLIGSVETRAQRAEQLYDMDRQDALHFIHKTDKDRARYLRDHFRKNIDDPLLYHLVINTDRVSYEDAARLIGDEVIQRFHLDKMTQAALAGP